MCQETEGREQPRGRKTTRRESTRSGNTKMNSDMRGRGGQEAKLERTAEEDGPARAKAWHLDRAWRQGQTVCYDWSMLGRVPSPTNVCETEPEGPGVEEAKGWGWGCLVFQEPERGPRHKASYSLSSLNKSLPTTCGVQTPMQPGCTAKSFISSLPRVYVLIEKEDSARDKQART